MLLAKELNIERGMQFSVFAVDYKLAPEFRYPSQLIETLAAYHHLVNTLGVSETKICLAGDSAGGCLSAGFLLHLARPNPAIKVPSELGPIPGPPAVGDHRASGAVVAVLMSAVSSAGGHPHLALHHSRLLRSIALGQRDI